MGDRVSQYGRPRFCTARHDEINTDKTLNTSHYDWRSPSETAGGALLTIKSVQQGLHESGERKGEERQSKDQVEVQDPVDEVEMPRLCSWNTNVTEWVWENASS